MAGDNRDWYRDWWRKKTNYVERSRFRMSEADRVRADQTARANLRAARIEQREADRKAAWGKVWSVVFFFVAFVVCVVFIKHLLKAVALHH